jgi:hypothetical protein
MNVNLGNITAAGGGSGPKKKSTIKLVANSNSDPTKPAKTKGTDGDKTADDSTAAETGQTDGEDKNKNHIKDKASVDLQQTVAIDKAFNKSTAAILNSANQQTGQSETTPTPEQVSQAWDQDQNVQRNNNPVTMGQEFRSANEIPSADRLQEVMRHDNDTVAKRFNLTSANDFKGSPASQGAGPGRQGGDAFGRGQGNGNGGGPVIIQNQAVAVNSGGPSSSNVILQQESVTTENVQDDAKSTLNDFSVGTN